MELHKINDFTDLPKYGKDVLIYGVDKKQYDTPKFHVAQMDDLEDGIGFEKTGEFYWLTENGTKIEYVTHWAYLPDIPAVSCMKEYLQADSKHIYDEKLMDEFINYNPEIESRYAAVEINPDFYSTVEVNHSISNLDAGIVWAPYMCISSADGPSKEYEEFMAKYKEDHKCCPNCGDVHYNTTLMGYVFNRDNPDEYKDLNRCVCSKCGFKHTRHERISKNTTKMNNKEQMLKFLNEKNLDRSFIVVEVNKITLKDTDDEDGTIGEHYIVECKILRDSELERHQKSCLINVQEFKKYLNKTQPINWL